MDYPSTTVTDSPHRVEAGVHDAHYRTGQVGRDRE
jgi:hypothetical protein